MGHVIEESFEKVVKYFEGKGAKKLFHGNHRAAMVRGKFIYKLPFCDEGVVANFEEEYIFKKIAKHKEAVVPYTKNSPVLNTVTHSESNHQVIGFARCKIIMVYRLPVLLMERLDPMDRYDKRKTDFMNRFDGGQFGVGRRGDFLCYDYSRLYEYNFKRDREDLENLAKYLLSHYRFGFFDAGRIFQTCNGCPDKDEVEFIRNS